jgi:bifunctional polynucleotide phosphatase/kinase
VLIISQYTKEVVDKVVDKVVDNKMSIIYLGNSEKEQSLSKTTSTTVKVASFDLDHTIIKPKDKRKHPKDKDDWVLYNAGVRPKLKNLHSQDYTIVIFTNQGSSKFSLEDFTYKLKKVQEALEVPFIVFVANESKIRKPSLGLWSLFIKSIDNLPIDYEKSFYIGDAAGRPTDFSDSDLKFALNIKSWDPNSSSSLFGFNTPENYFSGKSIVPEEFKGPIPIHPLALAKVESDNIVSPKGKDNKEQEMIILVGPPAAGKSTLCRSKDFSSYKQVNQDLLGTKDKVLKYTNKCLSEKYSVIIDRKNEYRKDRQLFVELAKIHKVPVRVIYFDVPKELCLHLNKYRALVGENPEVPTIVYNTFYSSTKGLEFPELDEGFESIEKVKFVFDESKFDPIVKQYLV